MQTCTCTQFLMLPLCVVRVSVYLKQGDVLFLILEVVTAVHNEGIYECAPIIYIS